MDNLNLLEHSTYNVEEINKNREFYSHLLKEITDTYRVYDSKEYEEKNTKKIKFAPTNARIQNVFMSMNVKGKITIVFAVGYLGKNKEQILKDLKEYEIDDSSSSGIRISIKGITFANYKKHLKNIVFCIELCDYSFK